MQFRHQSKKKLTHWEFAFTSDKATQTKIADNHKPPDKQNAVAYLANPFLASTDYNFVMQ